MISALVSRDDGGEAAAGVPAGEEEDVLVDTVTSDEMTGDAEDETRGGRADEDARD